MYCILCVCLLVTGASEPDSSRCSVRAFVDPAEEITVRGDSVFVVSGSRFALEPFGSIKGPAQVARSPLRIFSVSSFRKRQPNGEFQYHRLRHRSSLLHLRFQDDPEASPGVDYSIYGVVRDSTVPLPNGVRVGMSMDSFLDIYFERFPAEYRTATLHVVVDHCVASLRQIYRCEHGTLRSVEFIRPFSGHSVP